MAPFVPRGLAEAANKMIGTSLNQYRITASIGAGGMGEVFRARDTRLNRDVAIKVLPKDFASDGERLRRFEQEAKTLAALNHPNVLTIHDAGVHEGAPYLVSELLGGRTLREEMKGAALPVRKATEFALQIAHGLAAAHGKGIIHRDLKPENIFITKDGRVKILDFGLAKLKAPVAADVRRLHSKSGEKLEPPHVGCYEEGEAATIRIDADAIVNTTEPGMVLGTPAYMSPEQVRGEPADHRADIFAFGCVLYEMLSGTRAFRRDTPVASMNAVLSEEPPELSVTNANIPLALERVVRRCLDKAPERRFQTADDLAFAIENAGTSSSAALRSMPAPQARLRQILPWAIAAVCLAGLGFALLRQKVSSPSATRQTPVTSVRKIDLHLLSRARPMTDGEELHPAISPDGRKLAYADADGLWLRPLDRFGPPVQLVAGDRIIRPFWSPQSSDIAYFDGPKLARVSIEGGTPMILATVSQLDMVSGSGGAGSGGAWLTDNRILFASGLAGLDEISAQGGAVRTVWQPNSEDGEVDLHEASPLPGGIGVLVVVHRAVGVDTIAVWTRSGGKKIVWQETSGVGELRYPVYSTTGHVLFQRVREEQGIWAFPFSLEKLERTGELIRVTDSGTVLSISDDSTLVMATSRLDPFGRRQFIWVDRSGAARDPFGPILPGLSSPRLSSDGRRVAAAAGHSFQALDIWVIDVTGGALPVTRYPAPELEPSWWNNGRSIVFNRYQSERHTTLSTSADGAGGEQVLFDGLGIGSPGEKYFVLRRNSTNNWFSSQQWHYTEAGSTNQRPLKFPEAFVWLAQPELSADERWLTFAAQTLGQRSEIWVADFPAMTNRTMVTREGGRIPRWHPRGNEVFFLSLDGKAMMSARRKTDTAGFDAPQKVFDVPESIFAGSGNVVPVYDVAPEGERFLMMQRADHSSSTNQVTSPNALLVQNWFEEFRGKK